MILHVVLFQPRESLSSGERQQVLHAVTAAVSDCPTVRSARVGRRVRHGLPGYEQAMRDPYEYALVLEFDDVDGLKAYLTRPEHERVGELFTTAGSAALAYDYDVMGLADAQRLL